MADETPERRQLTLESGGLTIVYEECDMTEATAEVFAKALEMVTLFRERGEPNGKVWWLDMVGEGESKIAVAYVLEPGNKELVQ